MATAVATSATDDGLHRPARRAPSAPTARCSASASTPTRHAFPSRCAATRRASSTSARAIVDATRDLVIAFKPQIAYFAAHRAEDQLERLIAHIHAQRAGRAGDPRRQARRHRLDRRAVRARGVRALRRRRGDAVAVHGLRLDRALPAPRRQGRDPALPHLQPRRRRPAGAAARRRASGSTSASPGWRPAPGTAPASSAWSSAPPSRPRSPACASSRRRCRCSSPASARRAATPRPRCAPAGAATAGATTAPIIVSSSRAVLYPAGATGTDFALASRRAAAGGPGRAAARLGRRNDASVGVSRAATRRRGGTGARNRHAARPRFATAAVGPALRRSHRAFAAARARLGAPPLAARLLDRLRRRSRAARTRRCGAAAARRVAGAALLGAAGARARSRWSSAGRLARTAELLRHPRRRRATAADRLRRRRTGTAEQRPRLSGFDLTIWTGPPLRRPPTARRRSRRQIGRAPWELGRRRHERGAARRAPGRPRGASAVQRPDRAPPRSPTAGRALHSVSGEPRFTRRSGVFDGYWGVARDVTDEIRAQRAFAASETRYRELFERSPSPIFLHRQGVIFDANPSAARLFGFADAEAMKGLRMVDLLSARRIAAARRATGSPQLEALPVGEGMPVRDFQARTARRPADQRPGDRRAGRRRRRPGDPDDLFDITARLAAEAALRRSEAMLSHLFATSPDCIALYESRQRPATRWSTPPSAA